MPADDEPYGTVACPDGPGCAPSALSDRVAARVIPNRPSALHGDSETSPHEGWSGMGQWKLSQLFERMDVDTAAEVVAAVADGTLGLVDRIVALADAPDASDSAYGAEPCHVGVAADLVIVGAAADRLVGDRSGRVDQTTAVAAAKALLTAHDCNIEVTVRRYDGSPVAGLMPYLFAGPAGTLVGTTVPHPDPDHLRGLLHEFAFDPRAAAEPYAMAYVDATLRHHPCGDAHRRVCRVARTRPSQATAKAAVLVVAEVGVCCDDVEALLVDLVSAGDGSVAGKLAEGEATPTGRLLDLLRDGSTSVRRKLVARDDLPVDADELLGGPVSVVRTTLKNYADRLTADQWTQVAAHESPSVRQSAVVYTPDAHLVDVLRIVLDETVSGRLGTSIRRRVDDAADGVVPDDLRAWVWAITGQ